MNAHPKREDCSPTKEEKQQLIHQSKRKHAENGATVDLDRPCNVKDERIHLVEDKAAIEAQDSWNTEVSQVRNSGGFAFYEKSQNQDEEGIAGKRRKMWKQHAPGNRPVEAFPAYYLGASVPHPVDFLYPTDDHMPTFSSETDPPGTSNEIHGNFSSFRISPHFRHHPHQQPWVEQPHEYHRQLPTDNFSDLQVHSFSEDFPLSACFSGPHEYPQWEYSSPVQNFASVTPNSFTSDSTSPMYYGHEYSLVPASMQTNNPHYFHSQQTTYDTVAEVPNSPPRDFSESKSTSLYIACDAESLSEYQCLIRKQIEFFSATYLDIEMTVQGRNRKIHAGQVGVRCRHCADMPIKKRARGAVYYPSKLSCIYQAAQNMASVHLVQHCTRVPELIRTELMKKDRKSSAGSGKDYWAVGARSMGIIEIDGRLWYESDAAAFQDSSLTMI